MTSAQIAHICTFAARMALSRSDLVEWVESNRATIEAALPEHAGAVIEQARKHYRGLAR